MSYCMRCGKQTDNEDFVCDECRRKEGAVSGAAVRDAPAQASDGGADAAANGRQGAEFQSAADNRPQAGWQPRAAAGQPYYNRPYGSVPNTPWAAPYVPPEPIAPADRSQLPLNKCGLIGMIFSLAAVVSFLAMIIVLFALFAQNPQWLDNPYYQPTTEEMATVMMSIILPLIFTPAFSVTGVVLSSAGIAMRKRFRAVGFAIAGLTVGIVMLLVFLSLFSA